MGCMASKCSTLFEISHFAVVVLRAFASLGGTRKQFEPCPRALYCTGP